MSSGSSSASGSRPEMSDVPVEVVVFDAGLTLVHASPSFLHVFVAGLRNARVDVTVEDFQGWDAAFRQAWRSHGETWQEAGEPSPHLGDLEVEQRFWRGLYVEVLGRIGLDGDHPEIARHIHEAFLDPHAWGPYPEVEDVLDTLTDRGVRIALLSNWSAHLRQILETHGLSDRFEEIVISGEIGIAKPDLAIFDRMLDALGELPGPHVAYVGDDVEHDIEPSRRLGLRTVLVDRRDERAEHDGARVRDLRDLPAVLPLARPVAGR